DARIAAAKAHTGHLQHFIPGDFISRGGLELCCKSASGTIGKNQLRGGQGYEPLDNLSVARTHEHVPIDGWIGADENVGRPHAIVDHLGSAKRSLGFSLIAASRLFDESWAESVFHHRCQGTRIQNRYTAAWRLLKRENGRSGKQYQEQSYPDRTR